MIIGALEVALSGERLRLRSRRVRVRGGHLPAWGYVAVEKGGEVIKRRRGEMEKRSKALVYRTAPKEVEEERKKRKKKEREKRDRAKGKTKKDKETGTKKHKNIKDDTDGVCSR